MRPFTYQRPDSLAEALALAARPSTTVLAGGTTLVDLMRQGIETPSDIVDIRRLAELAGSTVYSDRIEIGALTPMSRVAEHAAVRTDFPALAQSLQQAASQQLRNGHGRGQCPAADSLCLLSGREFSV
ncbi:CO/xanthine dehydrogenase FAD-binding subunit [Saccharopolyspora phatthalungensis]|uniref:CO/xanthine dehydrogenase FAD-binding subunit n=1 Tax=Saccharopolyspora phatthalungensis TaxID=664693 RepID=A0A840QAM7_9PSEU|nr:CO/xanthine dehydrogenase FAD-binding subunit [Saccharopolyspora phatthalungensis]